MGLAPGIAGGTDFTVSLYMFVCNVINGSSCVGCFSLRTGFADFLAFGSSLKANDNAKVRKILKQTVWSVSLYYGKRVQTKKGTGTEQAADS